MAKGYFASLPESERIEMARKGAIAHWRQKAEQGKTTLWDRFHSKLRKTDGCWIWTGSTVRGYGCIRSEGKIAYAHRVSYELFKGAVAAGLYVCHHCDVRLCVNPEHLFVGTANDNSQDAKRKGRTRNNPARGECSPHAKLTDITVRELRKLYSEGMTQADLSRRFGLSGSAIRNAATGRTWAHVQ